MLPFHRHRSSSLQLLLVLACALSLSAQSAYIRVNQAGYEIGSVPFRAYLMSRIAPTADIFELRNSKGEIVHTGRISALLGTWAHSSKVTYNVYALDFDVPGGDLYSITLPGAKRVVSPAFAVDTPENLYSGLLLNSLFFYRTQRDGAKFIPNALRTAPGHLKDSDAKVYQTPPLDENDFIDNLPPAQPLQVAGLPNLNASGGWWDAGDYEKYVETVSYTAALMQIGIRDFPNQMGAEAPVNPPQPRGSVSYAGDSGRGAPVSTDFSGEADFGVEWLLRMWDDQTKTLYYQVDNTQDWNYYGEGDPSSSGSDCGGSFASPFCLITEYDIWTLPQAADHFRQDGDPRACDLLTTYYICNRPVYVAGPPGSPISPNLAGRLAADFALCYQLHRTSHPSLANQCLRSGEDVFALADLTYPDPLRLNMEEPARSACSRFLLSMATQKTFGMTIWN